MNTAAGKNLSASLEDYLEAILQISKKTKVARSRDIAEKLAVVRPSVTAALKTLKKKKLINYRPYGYITLTDAGRAAAVDIDSRHRILTSFFASILGVNSRTAQKGACKAEHVLGQEIINRLLKFIEFVGSRTDEGCNLAVQFQKFCSGKKL